MYLFVLRVWFRSIIQISSKKTKTREGTGRKEDPFSNKEDPFVNDSSGPKQGMLEFSDVAQARKSDVVYVFT
ncbi:hypothetical protein M5689_009930 [Euphorbia peplus]|nr:hypothetical protein M5689_009930 [Euphorbia peplus]